MKRKELWRRISHIVWALDEAADRTGAHREFAELLSVIEQHERAHRRLGRRLVGSGATAGRFSVRMARDLFVVATMANAWRKGWERPISELRGVREDYVRAAIMSSDQAFRCQFVASMRKCFPGEDAVEVLFATADAADYAELAKPTKGNES